MKYRNKFILEFWDRSKELTLKNRKYQNYLQKFWYFLLSNDIGKGDITTNSIIKKNKKISVNIISKEDGILAGSEEIIFLNKDLKIMALKEDGDRINKGDILLEIIGDARKILTGERIILNILQRMSGIATATDNLSKKMKKMDSNQSNIKIAATRKTLWGYMDKKAVSVGGGLTHRLNLSDGILIKDNHLKIMRYNIEKALGLTKNKSNYVEIEVENREQALSAAMAIKKISPQKEIFFAIMLDKIKPDEIRHIVAELKNRDLYDNILFEASGNITPDNIASYKNCGADIISMGWLTNSAKALDMSLDIH